MISPSVIRGTQFKFTGWLRTPWSETPTVVELPFEVTKRITFDELVTDININRLQEVVNKRLYVTVPVMTSII